MRTYRTDEPDHVETMEWQYGNLTGLPLYRRACSCGYRGVWLRDPEKVQPCARKSRAA